MITRSAVQAAGLLTEQHPLMTAGQHHLPLRTSLVGLTSDSAVALP